jgi:hypothetical protein
VALNKNWEGFINCAVAIDLDYYDYKNASSTVEDAGECLHPDFKKSFTICVSTIELQQIQLADIIC